MAASQMADRNVFNHRLSTTLIICLVYPLGPAAIILMPMIVGGLVDNYGFTEQQAANIASFEGLGVVAARHDRLLSRGKRGIVQPRSPRPAARFTSATASSGASHGM